MKKPFHSIAISALSLTLGLSLLASSTSQASFLSYVVPIAISDSVFQGLSPILIASGLGTAGLNLTKYKDSKVTKNFAKVFLATFVVIAVLDDSGNQRVVLQPVSDELAGKAGLSAQEAQAYNSELDVAQQVLDQISSEVAQASEQDRVAVAHASWEKYRGMMSVDAFNGLLKLTAAAVNS
jgi:hypothetical protein